MAERRPEDEPSGAPKEGIGDRPAPTGADAESKARRDSLASQLGAYVLVGIPAAYVAGYVAWTSGTGFMGFGFLGPDPVRIVALGTNSLILGAAYFLGAFFGRQIALDRARKHRRWPGAVGTVYSTLAGAVVAGSATLIITSATGIHSTEPIATMAAVGAIFSPGIMWLAYWYSRDSKTREIWHDSMRDGLSLAGVLAVSLMMGGLALGVAAVPHMPNSAGGLAPSPALITAIPGYAFPAALQPGAAEVDGNASQVAVWVFPSGEGDWLVRPACGSVRGGPAFLIPKDAVQSVQWIMEGTRSRHCTAPS